MTTPKVAKMPATLQEFMKMNLSADDLMQYSLEELETLHSLAKQGQTKIAKLQTDMLDGRIKSKRKEMAKENKKPEPVANSTKAQEKAEDNKPASGKAGTTAKTPRTTTKTPQAAKSAQAGRGKAGTDKGKVTAPKTPQKPAKKPTDTAPKRGSAKPVEDDQFLATFEEEGYRYERVSIKTVEDLGLLLIDNPYRVFAIVDEKQDDGNLTTFIVVYASHECTMLIDKSRKYNSFMQIVKKEVERNALVMTEGGQEYVFPFAFYVRTAIE